MPHDLQALLVLACFFCPLGLASFVTLGDRGYDNVLVKISDEVPSSNCAQILGNLQNLLQDVSHKLCKASGSRALFNTIAIIVPDEWTGNPACTPTSSSAPSWPRVGQADVIVGPTHPVFGDSLFTVQYGGCGVGGLPVYLPVSALSAGKGLDLVHEWFHYRYGVFDEVGLLGDALYPNGYQIPDGLDGSSVPLMPTSCTNTPLRGQWLDNQWQNGNNNDNVTSSLMFSTQLPNMNQPCTKENHLKAPPTKHNWLCASKSVDEVLQQHEDFTNFGQLKFCSNATISVTTNPFKGYHVILDVSSAMNASGLFRSVKSALSHFIWFLPQGTRLSVDTFSSGAARLQLPVVLNFTTKNTVLDVLNGVQLDHGDTLGLPLALDNAVEAFKSGMEVVLITAGSSFSASFPDSVELVQRNLVGVRVVALTPSTYEVAKGLARYGANHLVPVGSTDSREPHTWMVDTLHAIYSGTRQYRPKVFEKTMMLVNGRTNGTFHVDSAQSTLIFAFYNLDDGNSMNFIIGAVYSPSGERCGNLISRPNKINDLFQVSCPVTQSGTWSYTINIEGTSLVRLDVWLERPLEATWVNVTGLGLVRYDARLQESSSSATVSTWTNKKGPIDLGREPVVIYASVHYRMRPVSDVGSIVVVITGSNSTRSVRVTLNENNPTDVTRGDGIYSATVFNLPRDSTSFTYVVEVLDGRGTIDSGSFKGHPSAGSSITITSPMTLTTPFNRFVYGGSFQLTALYDGRDVWPPGRSSDLRVNWYSANSSSLELRWTAPRDDFGSSSLTMNRFRITLENGHGEATIFNGTVQSLPGSLDQMSRTFVVPASSNGSGNVYFRVYAVDGQGNEGLPSNTATVYVFATAVDPNPPLKKGGLPPALFWSLVGIAAASVLLLFIVGVYCCCTRCKSKTKVTQASDWVYAATPENRRRTRPSDEPPATRPDSRIIKSILKEPSGDGYASSSSEWSDGSDFNTPENYEDETITVGPSNIEAPVNRLYKTTDATSQRSVAYEAEDLQRTSTRPPRPKMPPPKPPQRIGASANNLDRSTTLMAYAKSLEQLNKSGVTASSSPSYLSPSRHLKSDLDLSNDRHPPMKLPPNVILNGSKGRILLGDDSEASLV